LPGVNDIAWLIIQETLVDTLIENHQLRDYIISQVPQIAFQKPVTCTQKMMVLSMA